MTIKAIVAATDGSEESLRAVVIGRRATQARHAGLPGPGSVRNAVLSHAYGPVVIVPSS